MAAADPNGPERRVLVVDDDAATRSLLQKVLDCPGTTVAVASSAAEAMAKLDAESISVVLTDLKMSDANGLDLCRVILRRSPDVPVLVMTAFGSLETAVEAIRAGAYDYIEKPFDPDALLLGIDRALEHYELRHEVRRLKVAVEGARAFEELLGTSPTMRQVYSLLDRVSASDATVLVTGESGTGKEAVARALHHRSRRASGPFVAINCAALPESLLESELFGHVRGAFTDARTSRAGLFVEANGGTLLLDEIGEMPLGLQPKILRALEERKVRPIGAKDEVPFDVRLVASTNRNLEVAVEDGRFRADLYYRINVITVELPPLRARGADILLLAQHFLEQVAEQVDKPVVGISSAAAAKLLAYSWPGNVRELRNAIERAVALTSYDRVAPDDLPQKISTFEGKQVLVAGTNPSELVSLEEVEKRYILAVMTAVAGNKSEAARILGLNRKTLYRRLHEYGVNDD